MDTDHGESLTVQCQGCESQCDVLVRAQNGQVTDIQGNNCPTGASFAESIWRRTHEDNPTQRENSPK